MIPDVNLKSYYLQYIRSATSDIANYREQLTLSEQIKQKQYDYLNEHINTIKDTYNINLLDYIKEWVNKEYDNSQLLYNRCVKLLNTTGDNPNRIILIQLVKYCAIINNENKLNTLINLAKVRKDMKYGTYAKYVFEYYSKVHKTVLEGMGYKYSNGIGTFCINHWKMELDKIRKKKRIDFNATNIRKKELLAQGVKLFDEKLALWYKVRNIPYDGVDYRVYKEDTSFYDITFIKSDICPTAYIDYQRTEFISHKYRGMSYTKMSDTLCKTKEDIYNLQVDIKYKLNILIHQNPNIYLNYIRNAEQDKRKRGAHNS